MKAISPFDFVYDEDLHAEVVSSDTFTVPDASLSVKQILERYTRGFGLDGVAVHPLVYDEDGSYDDEDFNVHPSVRQDPDLTDQYLYASELNNLKEDIRNSQKKPEKTFPVDSGSESDQ